MIEMHYDDTKNHLKLPKNIRQVGKPGDKIKIYVEDYVITYINQISRESSDKQHLAVLLGRAGQHEKSDVVFIDGALEAENVVVQEDQVVFTSEIWTKIYDSIGQYFHNTEIVGWFLTRPGKSLGINDKITKLHVDNFPGDNKALFIVDPVDREDAFYIYREGELTRQEGYYIYYERNEDMQNYMVDHRGTESTEEPENHAFLKKREEILERRQEKKDKAHSSIKADALQGLKRAGSLVVTFGILFALIFGFSQLNSRESQQVSNNSGSGVVPVNVAEGDVKKQDEANAADNGSLADAQNDGDNTELVNGRDENIAVNADASQDGSSDNAVTDGSNNTTADGNNNTTADGNSNAIADGSDNSTADDNSNAVADGSDNNAADGSSAVADGGSNAVADGDTSDVPVQNVIRQYQVKDGDTLAGISQRFYNSYKYIEVIQEMNQIEDADKIYPGMTLKLP